VHIDRAVFFKTRCEYLKPSAILRGAEAQGGQSLAARSPGCVGSLDQRSWLALVSSTAASVPQTVLKTTSRSIRSGLMSGDQ
jgi:hypothetical protein